MPKAILWPFSADVESRRSELGDCSPKAVQICSARFSDSAYSPWACSVRLFRSSARSSVCFALSWTASIFSESAAGSWPARQPSGMCQQFHRASSGTSQTSSEGCEPNSAAIFLSASVRTAESWLKSMIMPVLIHDQTPCSESRSSDAWFAEACTRLNPDSTTRLSSASSLGFS